MTRSRTLLVALAAVFALALVIATITVIRGFVRPDPEQGGTDAARPRTADSERPRTAPIQEAFPEEITDERRPPPEPNVFGTVVDEDGNPIGQAWIEARFIFPQLRHTPIGDTSVTADEAGCFSFLMLEGKWCNLTCSAPGYRDHTQTLERPAKDLWVVLKGNGSLQGRVVDAETGEPVTRFWLDIDEEQRLMFDPKGENPDVSGADADDSFLDDFLLPPGFEPEAPPDEERGNRYPTGGAHKMSAGERLKSIGSPNDLQCQGGLAGSVTEADEGPRLFENDQGRFIIENVPDGRHSLTATAEGYGPVTIQDILLLDGVQVDELVIRMTQPAGVVGKVVDAVTGHPVPRAPVRGMEVEPPGFSAPVLLAVTGEDGSFALTMLRAGEAEFLITRRGYATLKQTVSLKAGETTPAVFRLECHGQITGRVVRKATGAALPGATIRKWDVWGGDQIGGTDEGGAFHLKRLAPGAYLLVVEHEGYADRALPPVHVAGGQAVDLGTIEVGNGARLFGTIRNEHGEPLQSCVYASTALLWAGGVGTDSAGNYCISNMPAGTWRVSILNGNTLDSDFATVVVELAEGEERRLDYAFNGDSSVSGRVSVRGHPYGFACVILESGALAELSEVGNRYYRTCCDEAGRFRFDYVPRGDYVVTVRVHEYSDALAVKAVSVCDHDVELDMHVPLGRISGRVSSKETGEPACHCNLKLHTVEADMDTKDQFTWGGSAVTDARDGSYSFEPLDDGRYYVVASAKGYANAGVIVQVREGAMVGTADIALTRGISVKGTIKTVDPAMTLEEATIQVYDLAGRPILEDGLDVDLSRPGRRLTREGRYVLSGLAPGTYFFEARSPFTAWERKQVTLVEGRENVVDFALPCGGIVIAHVVGPNGEPFQEALVEILDAGGCSRSEGDSATLLDWLCCISDRQGIVRFKHLAPGRYALFAEAPGYDSSEESVSVVEGETSRAEVGLRHGSN